MEEQLYARVEEILEDETWTSESFNSNFDEVFDDLFYGCNISAKEYVDMRARIRVRFGY